MHALNRFLPGEQIIAFLDTGAGKTFISVLLLRDVAADLRKAAADTDHASALLPDGGCARARPMPLKARRTRHLAFFLAPTVALVKQVPRYDR